MWQSSETLAPSTLVVSRYWLGAGTVCTGVSTGGAVAIGCARGTGAAIAEGTNGTGCTVTDTEAGGT